jgi:hypothetical protein
MTPRDQQQERIDREQRGAERPGHGDDHWTRRMPERMPRGANHWTRRMPERVPRGERARLAPEKQARGERVAGVKLTEEIVQRIRAAHAHGATQTRLACVYGVTKENVGYIVRRVTWKHVA